MNKQFEELAKQASKHVLDTIPVNNPAYAELAKLLAQQDNVVLNAFKEKFTELIVMECADTVLGFHNQFGDSAHNEIKQHFGVEE